MGWGTIPGIEKGSSRGVCRSPYMVCGQVKEKAQVSGCPVGCPGGAASVPVKSYRQETATTLTRNNLTRNAHAISEAAGLTPWAKTFNSLRASCKSDWSKDHGTDIASMLIGHGVEVGEKHYDETEVIAGAAMAEIISAG